MSRPGSSCSRLIFVEELLGGSLAGPLAWGVDLPAAPERWHPSVSADLGAVGPPTQVDQAGERSRAAGGGLPAWANTTARLAHVVVDVINIGLCSGCGGSWRVGVCGGETGWTDQRRGWPHSSSAGRDAGAADRTGRAAGAGRVRLR
jgi:hypothetical protein